jgi:vesicle-associated membrane protein 7
MIPFDLASMLGNFTTVTQNILDKIPSRDQKCTYVYDQYATAHTSDSHFSAWLISSLSFRYLFHYVREDGIVYLCLADEEFGRGPSMLLFTPYHLNISV